MLRSDLSDFSDVHIVEKGNIIVDKTTFTANDFNAPNNAAANATATNTENNNVFGEKKLFFKNNVPFINCISKFNGVQIDNSEDLDFVMPMYNLLEYSKIYRKTIEFVELLQGRTKQWYKWWYKLFNHGFKVF